MSNGIVQDDPEIIAQQTDKVDILLQCIKTANEEAAWIYGQVLCQMIRDLVPPKEILTKVIKEFLAINQPHSDVIAMIVFQVSITRNVRIRKSSIWYSILLIPAILTPHPLAHVCGIKGVELAHLHRYRCLILATTYWPSFTKCTYIRMYLIHASGV